MNIKKAVFLFCFISVSIFSIAQPTVTRAPLGFDSVRQDIRLGKLDTILYPSSTVDTVRKALVYTPPGFSKSKKYPVLYLLHGIGGDHTEWLVGGKAKTILDNGYANDVLEDMIVVMPNGRAMKDDRVVGNIFDSARVKAFSTFEQDLLVDLIPFIEKTYPVKTSRMDRAIAGLSMGGGQSLNFGLSHLDQFAWVGGFSSAPNLKLPEELVPDPAKTKALQLLWISCGIKDRLLSFSTRTHDYLKNKEIPHVLYLEPGDHEFSVWSNDLYMFSSLIFKPVSASQITFLNTEASLPH
jgi:enterochelin esterase-like enzyme